MHLSTLCSINLLAVPAIAHQQEYLPFLEPFTSNDYRPLLLLKRQSCLAGYTSCSSLGASQACCQPNTNCQLDQKGNVACCPINAACTGIIAGTGVVPGTTSTGGGIILGGSTTTTSNSLTTTSTSTTANPLTTTPSIGGGSTVPNAYYPFVYIPTTYANAADCSSAWSSCQAESTSCFNSLGGAPINGVTISGGNGGITVQGATATLAQASSVCNALSSAACYGLQPQSCNRYGTAPATTNNGFVVGSANAASPPMATGGVGMIYAMGAAGAVFGAAGVFV